MPLRNKPFPEPIKTSILNENFVQFEYKSKTLSGHYLNQYQDISILLENCV